APALAALAGKRFGVAELGAAPDRWGRRVVDLVDDGGRSVALDLIARGLALARAEADIRDCTAERLGAEAGARAAAKGLWADRDVLLDAADAAALAKADGRFVLVEGVVRRVGEGRAKVYLDFAGHNGFSVVAAKKAEPSFRRSGVDLKALAGRRVLVRGVMDDRFGPRIEIADPAMIEILAGAKGTGRGE
ncbi:MAG: DNA-binding protein, partial [Pseudomonadota bacterium]|nr:DNA-binding protein [Pseudomonadota bacterium]